MKFPGNSDFRELSRRYLKRKYKYYTYIEKRENKIWKYAKKSHITDEEDAKFNEGQEIKFAMLTNYPPGTKIWLVYISDIYNDYEYEAMGFLSRESAEKIIIRQINSLLEEDYETLNEDGEGEAESFYGATLEEFKKINIDKIKKFGATTIPNYTNQHLPINYIIKELTVL